MNDLFSGSFSRIRDQSPPPDSHAIDVTDSTSAAASDLNRFFEAVEAVRDELRELESLYSQLQAAHERGKTLHSAKAVKDLNSLMDADVSASVKKAKVIKVRLEALDRCNAANRSVPGCGPGSSSDRTRASVVNGLRKKLQDAMNRFSDLRQKMSSEYRETVQRRYFTVTGENPDEKIVDSLIETGESEAFLQKAIQQQGRGQVMDAVMEIQERHDAVKDMEKNLRELHQIFLDMAVLVQSQGEQLNDIQSNVNRANSFVAGGTHQLQVAKRHQKNTRKWACFGIALSLVVISIVVLSIQPWKR